MEGSENMTEVTDTTPLRGLTLLDAAEWFASQAGS